MKKNVIKLISFFLLAFIVCINVFAEDCVKIDGTYIDLDGEEIVAFEDENFSTKYVSQSEQIISVKANSPVSYAYIQFNVPPTEWAVTYETQFYPCGQYGFMKELVKFPTPQQEFNINIGKDTQICEITLFTEGELPKYVQQWQPPLDDSDILFLPTHADDEHLFFGSALSYYSIDTDKKVQVAYLTNHYGEWYRPHELLAGLWEVGVKNYPIIPEFKDMYSESLDNAKTLYDTDAMLEYQVELIRRFRPEVIVEHDENGEYGHGVHRLNAYLLKQSLELSNDATAYPQSARKFGVFDVPKAYFHLYGDTILDVDKIMCDGRTPLQATIDGFDHHKSQHQYFKVEKGGKYDFAKFGLYRSLVGEDVQKNDLFENIQVYSDKILPPTSSENTVSSDVSSNSESTVEVIGNTSSNISSDSTSSVPEGSVKHFFDVVKNINFISLAFILTGVLIIIITLKNHNKKEDAMVKYYMDRRK